MIRFPFRRNKPVVSQEEQEREAHQALNVKIVSCSHYSSTIPGTIYCKSRKGFVTLTDCKLCLSGEAA